SGRGSRRCDSTAWPASARSGRACTSRSASAVAAASCGVPVCRPSGCPSSVDGAWAWLAPAAVQPRVGGRSRDAGASPFRTEPSPLFPHRVYSEQTRRVKQPSAFFPTTVMRVLIVADIHGNWPALQAVNEPHDVCLCLGDLVDYALDAAPCIDWVR